MSSFNKLIVMGNLVADPEIRDIGDGLAKFTLALNDSYKGDEKPTYIDCEFWKPGKVAGYMAKGKPVLLEGRIKQERWQSQDGSNRSKLVMVVQRCTLVGNKTESRELVSDFA